MCKSEIFQSYPKHIATNRGHEFIEIDILIEILMIICNIDFSTKRPIYN